MTKLLLARLMKTVGPLGLGLFGLFSLVGTSMHAQGNITISGVVTDVQGTPIPGVAILVAGTQQGTTTDFDGNYSIAAAADATLEFRYLGFVPQTLAVNGRTRIDVALAEDTQLLEEVVVIGYGTMERANVTGAITTVDVVEVQKAPVANVVEALRGQVAGLQVTRTSGQPGSPPNFKIRGNNSLGASADGGSQLDQVNQPII